MATYKAKYPSYGFRRRYWEREEIAIDVTYLEEVESKELKAHFVKLNDDYSTEELAITEIALRNEADILEAEIIEPQIEEVIVDENNDKTIAGEEMTDAEYLETLRAAYLEKFNKNVPVNMKNNINWILNELGGIN